MTSKILEHRLESWSSLQEEQKNFKSSQAQDSLVCVCVCVYAITLSLVYNFGKSFTQSEIDII